MLRQDKRGSGSILFDQVYRRKMQVGRVMVNIQVGGRQPVQHTACALQVAAIHGNQRVKSALD